MIVFDLRCRKGHVFEAWFPDSAAYEDQAAGGKVACPLCGSRKVTKALMAPNVASSKDRPDPRKPEGRHEAVAMAETAKAAELRRLLRELRRHVEQNCDYVGERFAEEARKIHYGETDPRGIYGEASEAEAEALAEEGIEIARVPWLRENS